jgi:Tol biopolymer transport system component
MMRFVAAVVFVALQSGHAIFAQSPRSCRGGIVFDSDRTQVPAVYKVPDVYLINSDGSGERQLTFSKPGEFSRTPSVSRDGQGVVFQGRREPGGEGLFVLTCGDDHLTRVTPTGSAHPTGPTWSPDGRQIAFGQEGAILVIDADGSNIRKIAGLPSRSSAPSWSPDGKQIAFTSMGDVTWEIFAVELGNGRMRQLTRTIDARTASQAAAWSPDGKHIAFDRVQDGNFDIYVIDADGTNVKQLTQDAADDARPAWSPDGQSIVFHSTRARPAGVAANNTLFLDIYTMRADGTDVRRLTTNQYFDGHPDW